METGKILITGDFDIAEAHLSDRIVHLRTPKDDQDIIDHLSGVHHYIVGGPEYVNDRIMSYASDLKHIVVMGTGTNSFVDVKAAQSRGITVNNTPSINADAVAEYAVAATIFNLANSFYSSQNLLEGGWYQKPHKTLSETNIGIIGAGNIGQRIGKKIRALSSAGISYIARTRHPEFERECGAQFIDLEAMFNKSDAVVISVTYTPDTHMMIDKRVLQSARPGLILLNFSNPLIIDPIALKGGLETDKPALAFYDGYYNEWIANKGQTSDQHGLLSLGPTKFVATSHIAAQSHAVIAEILKVAFSKISQWERENSEATKPILKTGVVGELNS